MKRISRLTVMSLSIFAATSAFAADGYLTGDVNLRAGPDSSYPSVAMLGAGTSVAIQGCVDGWSWCDVAAGNNRGWVAGNFLQEEYQGRRVLVPSYGVQIGIPIVAFAFGAYWDDHYRNRSWYGERDRWSHVTPHYGSASVYSGSHGNPYPNAHENSQHVTHVESHSTYTPHNGSHDVRQTEVVAHSPSHVSNPTTMRHASPAVANEAAARPAAHNAAAPRTTVARAAPVHKAAPVAGPQHSKAVAEHKPAPPAAAVHKQAPKEEPRKEGDKDKDQH